MTRLQPENTPQTLFRTVPETTAENGPAGPMFPVCHVRQGREWIGVELDDAAQGLGMSPALPCSGGGARQRRQRGQTAVGGMAGMPGLRRRHNVPRLKPRLRFSGHAGQEGLGLRFCTQSGFGPQTPIRTARGSAAARTALAMSCSGYQALTRPEKSYSAEARARKSTARIRWGAA